MDDFSLIIFLFTLIPLPIIGLILVWRTIRKNKPRKNLVKAWVILLAICIISFVVFALTSCAHEYEVIEEVTATYEADGKIVKYCPLCEETFEEIVPKLTKETATIKPTDPQATQAPNTTKKPKESYSQVNFDEIYEAYEENEIVAKEKYEGNCYRITATINSINDGTGLLGLSDGATLLMQKQVGGTIVFFYATFPDSQKENLKKVKVGNTVTFDGYCYSGNFTKCKLYAINY